MGADDWRYEYLSNELQEHRKRLEEAERLVKQSKSELEAAEWQRDKYKVIVEMLDVAYKVNVTNRSKPVTSCAQKVETKE
jgi:F0F1-type ATP synthase membrane subunit b/b'